MIRVVLSPLKAVYPRSRLFFISLKAVYPRAGLLPTKAGGLICWGDWRHVYRRW
jgi:hypothetical protein